MPVVKPTKSAATPNLPVTSSKAARAKYAKVGGFEMPDPEETAALSKAGRAGGNVYHEDYDLIKKVSGEDNPGRLAGTMAAVSANTPFPREVRNAIDLYGNVRQEEAEKYGGRTLGKVLSRSRILDLLKRWKNSGRIHSTIMSTQIPNAARVLSHPNPAVHGEPVLSGAKVDEYRQARIRRGSMFPLDTHELTILGLKGVDGLQKLIHGTFIKDPGTGKPGFRVSSPLHHAVREFGSQVTQILNQAGPNPGQWDNLKTQAAQWSFLRAVIDAAAGQEGEIDLRKAVENVTHEKVANGVSLGSVIFQPDKYGDHSEAYRMMQKVGFGHLLPEMEQMYRNRLEERGAAKTPVLADLTDKDVNHILRFLNRMAPQILSSAEMLRLTKGKRQHKQATQYRRLGSPLRYAAVPAQPAAPMLGAVQPTTMPAGPNLAPPEPSPEAQHREHLLAYSPNTDEGLTFEDAIARVRSGNQKAFKQIIKHVNEQIGLKAQLQDAIGDWSDGAENSVLQKIDEPIDPKTADYLAAWYGLLGNQKAVLSFTPSYNGEDSVYQIELPQTDMAQIRSQLDKAGIPFRTLVPSKKGTKIVVYDQGRALRDQVAQFAGSHNATIRESIGQGRFIGGDTRTAARSKYRKIITAYESAPGRGGSPVPTYRPPVLPHHIRSGSGEAGSEGQAGPIRQARKGQVIRYAAGLEAAPPKKGVFYSRDDLMQESDADFLKNLHKKIVPPQHRIPEPPDVEADPVEIQAGHQNQEDLELSQQHGEHISGMAKKILESGSRGAWLTLVHLGLRGYADELMSRHKGRVRYAAAQHPATEAKIAVMYPRDKPVDPVAELKRMKDAFVGYLQGLGEIGREAWRRAGKKRRKYGRQGGVKSPPNGVIVRGLFYPGGRFIPSANLEKAKYDQYRHVEDQRARYAKGDFAGALKAEAGRHNSN